jgi:hypothetical protein
MVNWFVDFLYYAVRQTVYELVEKRIGLLLTLLAILVFWSIWYFLIKKNK